MTIDFMNSNDARTAADWMTEKMRRASGDPTALFPSEWIPDTGLAARDDDESLLAVATLYLDRSAPVAVAGWCVANPKNPARKSTTVIKLLLAALKNYARSLGAKHLMTIFGNPGINRICEQLGFVPGEKIQQKYFRL